MYGLGCFDVKSIKYLALDNDHQNYSMLVFWYFKFYGLCDRCSRFLVYKLLFNLSYVFCFFCSLLLHLVPVSISTFSNASRYQKLEPSRYLTKLSIHFSFVLCAVILLGSFPLSLKIQISVLNGKLLTAYSWYISETRQEACFLEL